MKLNNLTKKTMVSALALTLATSTFAFAADTTTSSNTRPVLTKPAISLDKAKSIAITDSGLNESDLAFLNIRLKPDFKSIDIEKIKERPMHNREEYKNLERNYEVEFRTFDNKEYDYTINSKTGVIMEKDNEIKKGHMNKNKDFKGQKNPNFKNKGMVRGSNDAPSMNASKQGFENAKKGQRLQIHKNQNTTTTNTTSTTNNTLDTSK